MGDKWTPLLVIGGVAGAGALAWWLLSDSPARDRPTAIVKGTDVRFVLKGGRRVVPPRSYGMIHDPTGRRWPRCSVLVTSFREGSRLAAPRETRGAPRDYFGRPYPVHVGSVNFPRGTKLWTRVGAVERIFYWRTGDRPKVPGLFQHPFGLRRAEYLFAQGALPVLYRRGGAYRLEFARGCTIDDRGYVFP